MSNYVIDTHPLIWLKTKQIKKVSRRIKKIFDDLSTGQHTIFVPAPVVWELGYQYRQGALQTKKYIFFKDWVNNELFTHPNIQFIETSLDDVLFATDFKVNKDPFDSLIVASSIRLDMPLITKDESITVSGACETIW